MPSTKINPSSAPKTPEPCVHALTVPSGRWPRWRRCMEPACGKLVQQSETEPYKRARS